MASRPGRLTVIVQFLPKPQAPGALWEELSRVLDELGGIDRAGGLFINTKSSACLRSMASPPSCRSKLIKILGYFLFIKFMVFALYHISTLISTFFIFSIICIKSTDGYFRNNDIKVICIMQSMRFSFGFHNMLKQCQLFLF